MLVARMGQPYGEVAVVSQQQQPFAVLIQPAHGVQPLRHLHQRFPGRKLGARIGTREITRGFIEDDVAMLFNGNRLAIDPDVGQCRIRAPAQLRDHATVYGHTAGLDQFLARTPRADTGLGEHLL